MKVSVPLRAAFGLILCLAVLKPLGHDVTFIVAFLYQLYVPLWLSKSPLTPLFQKGGLKQDLLRVLWVSSITFSVFALGYYGLQYYWASSRGYEVYFYPAFSWGLFSSFLINLVLIAYPEEVFYRGYLQSALRHDDLSARAQLCHSALDAESWIPAQGRDDSFRLIGLRGILILNLFFALGHFVGDYNLSRLLPFFPGLVFSWLVYRSGSLAGATFYHALCNVFSEWLAASCHWSHS